MANATKCKAPNVRFAIQVAADSPRVIGIQVEMPFDMVLSEEQKIDLRNTLHNQIELSLSSSFAAELAAQACCKEENSAAQQLA